MRRIPVTLWLAWLFGFAASMTWTIARYARPAPSSYYDLQAMLAGVEVAQSFLLVVGYFELARWAIGPGRRGAQVAGGTNIVTLVLFVTLTCVSEVPSMSVLRVSDVAWRCLGALDTIVAIALVVGAAALRDGRLAIAGIVLVAAEVFGRGWVPVLGPRYLDAIHDVGWLPTALHLVRVTCTILLVARIAEGSPGPTPDPALAERGLRRAARALWFRLIVAGLLVFAVLISLSGKRSDKLVIFATAVAPAVVIVSTLVFAWGLVDAARSRLDGLATGTLYAGVVALVASLGIQIAQLASAVGSVTGGSRSVAVPWPYFAPLLLVAGIAMIGSAIAGFAGRIDRDLHQIAIGRTLGVIVCLVGQVFLPLVKVSTRSTAIMVFLLTATLGVVAIALFAALLGRVAESIHRASNLPQARVV